MLDVLGLTTEAEGFFDVVEAGDGDALVLGLVRAEQVEVREIATRIPAGQVYLNGSGTDLIDFRVPSGGHKKPGNGREWGEAAFEAFLEPVSLIGYTPQGA